MQAGNMQLFHANDDALQRDMDMAEEEQKSSI